MDEALVPLRSKLLSAFVPASSVPFNIQLKNSTCEVVSSSRIRLSFALVEEMSVPFIEMEPSITETNPVAALVFAWPVENVRVSPTSYRVPASSITTPLTLPVLIVSTFVIASALPTAKLVSSSILSSAE